ncbi:lipoyl(octanoyl) transferase [Dysgonomonas sp. PH5-45]|uniref:lipoyl(octanoyl) transferase LipB n=1 Tax=unclassified Dysgonomonas TaxID=2630389 RepID=UPI0024757099|nr:MULTISPECIES: lipoyl(octanoyl) transferase LipB [unclassified Dysgonomonas]MDH6353891.1 lipoyl(octanoyl) transferase [Dysgonomonas sp. PH5-45]MDH6386793.1 lipoyl(octanoyl) transferase [Dysgonomonas sp. PH5-37]
MEYLNLNLIEYAQAWQLQEKLFDANLEAKKNETPTTNTLILCEHPHVITIGKSGKTENLLYSDEYLTQKGVSVFRINRGGDVTYHGPGQLVGYPIFDLEHYHLGLRQYIYNVEEVIIRFLSRYNISAERLEGATGVWIDTHDARKARKIAAIGVRSSRFVTMHGFALNINTDMSYFSLINPCGFVDKGVTSVEKEIGRKLDMQSVKEEIKHLFTEVFSE